MLLLVALTNKSNGSWGQIVQQLHAGDPVLSSVIQFLLNDCSLIRQGHQLSGTVAAYFPCVQDGEQLLDLNVLCYFQTKERVLKVPPLQQVPLTT